MYLNSSVVSACCHAPIRLGFKTLTKSKERVKIWICTRCKTRDINTITKEEAESQIDPSIHF